MCLFLEPSLIVVFSHFRLCWLVHAWLRLPITLGNQAPIVLVRGTPATDATRDNNGGDNQEKQGSLQQLKNVEKMLDEEGGGTSDTAVTSDEEITTHKVPQESTIDKAILEKKV